MLWGSKPKKKNVDHERYADLVAPHIDAAYNFAYRLCGDRNNASDIT
jgi:DNA-directed RNA polymerase specialized sigma24 family protein